MAKFDIGETMICSIEIKDDDGDYKDPSGDTQHTKITITDKHNVVKANDVVMDNDGVGKYHYDFQTVDCVDGEYTIEYRVTDGTRITIKKETFKLE